MLTVLNRLDFQKVKMYAIQIVVHVLIVQLIQIVLVQRLFVLEINVHHVEMMMTVPNKQANFAQHLASIKANVLNVL